METRFNDALEGLHVTGASVSAREVVNALDRHGAEELEILQRYERFAESAEDPVARYVVQLIVDDERRHHQLLGELANTIAWGPVSNVPAPVLPSVVGGRGDAAGIRAETRAFLRHELRDRRQFRRLRRRVGSYADAPLWTLLVDVMRWDTEKHIAMLRCLLRQSDGPRWWRFARVRGGLG